MSMKSVLVDLKPESMISVFFCIVRKSGYHILYKTYISLKCDIFSPYSTLIRPDDRFPTVFN